MSPPIFCCRTGDNSLARGPYVTQLQYCNSSPVRVCELEHTGLGVREEQGCKNKTQETNTSRKPTRTHRSVRAGRTRCGAAWESHCHRRAVEAAPNYALGSVCRPIAHPKACPKSPKPCPKSCPETLPETSPKSTGLVPELLPKCVPEIVRPPKFLARNCVTR